jgi:hypothetical protein
MSAIEVQRVHENLTHALTSYWLRLAFLSWWSEQNIPVCLACTLTDLFVIFVRSRAGDYTRLITQISTHYIYLHTRIRHCAESHESEVLPDPLSAQPSGLILLSHPKSEPEPRLSLLHSLDGKTSAPGQRTGMIDIKGNCKLRLKAHRMEHPTSALRSTVNQTGPLSTEHPDTTITGEKDRTMDLGLPNNDETAPGVDVESVLRKLEEDINLGRAREDESRQQSSQPDSASSACESVSPGHFTSHVVYPLTNQSTTPCIYPASGTHP